MNDKSLPLTECEFHGQSLTNPRNLCRSGAKDVSATWLVYGDSHAWAGHAMFDEWLKERGQAGLFIFRHSCPPLIGIHLVGDHEACFAFNQAVSRALKGDVDLKNILLVSTWREASEGRLSTSSEVPMTKEESVGIFRNGFSETVNYFNNLQRRVYVWEPVPGARDDVPIALAHAALSHKSVDLEFSLAQYLDQTKFFFDVLKENRNHIEGVFSPAKVLCASGKCEVEHDGKPLYFDNNHMTKSTADYWVQVMEGGYSGR